MSREVVGDILAHYGTKGMKWGVKKSGAAKPRLTKQPYHKDYASKLRSPDKTSFGKRGVNRINNRLLDGHTYDQARTKEVSRKNRQAKIKAGAVVAAYLLANYGPEIAYHTKDTRDGISRNAANYIAQRAETKRGQRFAADHFGLGMNEDINAKKNRKGVYNVTSM